MDLEELIKLLMSKGVDVENVLLDALSVKDPGESANERIRLAEKYMNEARDYLSKGDAVQASEEAYKAAGECIKALAEKYSTPEYQEFLREGRWRTYLLGRASKTLSRKFGDWVLSGWSVAYDLHVWGFHEGKYGVDHVAAGMEVIERMVKEARRIVLGSNE